MPCAPGRLANGQLFGLFRRRRWACASWRNFALAAAGGRSAGSRLNGCSCAGRGSGWRRSGDRRRFRETKGQLPVSGLDDCPPYPWRLTHVETRSRPTHVDSLASDLTSRIPRSGVLPVSANRVGPISVRRHRALGRRQGFSSIALDRPPARRAFDGVTDDALAVAARFGAADRSCFARCGQPVWDGVGIPERAARRQSAAQMERPPTTQPERPVCSA